MTRDIQIRPGEFDAEARDALARCLKRDTTGGLASVDEVVAGGMLFEIVRGADVVCRYVLRPIEREHGTEVQIVAAAGGAKGLDVTALGMAAILKQAEGAAAVSLHTRSLGLVRKLARQGFTVDGFILRKRLAPCH